MAIHRISEVEGPPIVGKYYLVPCVLDAYMELTPIIGPVHDDKEIIGADFRHWHIDMRFASRKVIDSSMPPDVWPSFGWSREARAAFAMSRVLDVRYLTSVLLERKLKCKREMPNFPPNRIWLPKLEAAYKSVKLSSCLKCPHRGMELKNLPQDEHGNVVCNGHGLKWNINTGEMVSRLV